MFLACVEADYCEPGSVFLACVEADYCEPGLVNSLFQLKDRARGASGLQVVLLRESPGNAGLAVVATIVRKSGVADRRDEFHSTLLFW